MEHKIMQNGCSPLSNGHHTMEAIDASAIPHKGSLPPHQPTRYHDANLNLLANPLFSTEMVFDGYLSYAERVRVSLKRAKAIIRAYALTAVDVETLTQPFWDLHVDPAMAMDTAAGTFVTIQLNLVAGTLVKYLKDSPSLNALMNDILAFDVLIMPPTSPCGIPAVGIVFAKLIVKGDDYGIRPFILSLNDGNVMMPGISAKLLPPREGPPPLNHSITVFNRVKLPPSALLGPLGVLLEDRMALRAHHMNTIWRTAVGALALGGSCISALDRSAFIAGRYSQRRTVGLPDQSRVAILSFRTQHAPILTTLAQAFVAKELFKVAVRQFSDTSTDIRVRQAWACIVKATLVDHTKIATLVLSERCGAQGLFAYNQICSLHASLLGLSTAEGDTLGLCIRKEFALLFLALHEQGLLNENRTILAKINGHRSADFNHQVLPKSESIVRAIGHRMAYDAAVDAGLDATMTSLYLATTVKADSVWYSENLGYGRDLQDAAETEAICAALPCLDEWLDRSGAERYSQVPIVSESNWDSFVEGLQEFGSGCDC
ncbi:acyl-CoA dehydrogenase NM domain-like protein [Mycena rebaudengoi]|nr:acyl-CoA dehydrogenase NM domain-like protein [Mycena rebaudengoi]